MDFLTNGLEALMVLCFGLSWPISVRKSWISRTAKGKSLMFEVFIWVGYVFGISRKLLLWKLAEGAPLGFMFWLGAFFYVFNLLAISVDMLLYARNVRLDKKRDAEEAKAAQAAQTTQA